MLRSDKKRKRTLSIFNENKIPRREVSSTVVEIVMEPQHSLLMPVSMDLDRGQDLLIDKINSYLRKKQRPLLSTEGYCFGSSIVWLQKMSSGNVDWFYKIRDKILACPDEMLEEIELDIEKFTALIEWGQNSRHYLDGMGQDEIAKLLECENVEYGRFVGSQSNLSALLRDRRSVIMYLIVANEHVVAVYQSGSIYHLFDANHPSAMAEIVCCRHELVKKIINDLYKNFNIQVPELLDLNVGRIRDVHAFKINQTIIECAHYNNKSISDVEMSGKEEEAHFNACTIL